uniref:Kinase family protein n=1 Tax=Rhizophora mucronata TaxID=61149 RepID=A0A2P2N5F1_RHIMU
MNISQAQYPQNLLLQFLHSVYHCVLQLKHKFSTCFQTHFCQSHTLSLLQ